MCSVKSLGKVLIKYLIGERALTGTRNTGYAGKDSERNLNINVLKVILSCSVYRKETCRL